MTIKKEIPSPIQLPLQSEAALLGLLIVNPKVFNDVSDIIQPFMFPSSDGKKIAELIWEYNYELKEYDLAMLSQKFGSEVIEKYMRLACSRNVAKDHAYIILEKWKQVELFKAASELRAELTDQDGSTVEVLSNFEDIVTLIQSNVVGEDRKEAVLIEVAKMVKEARDKDGLTGISSGFPSIDAITSGFQEGTLGFVAGRPHMGKTTVMCELAIHAMEQGKNVIYFSLGDSTAIQLYRKIAGMISETPQLKLIGSEPITNEELLKFFKVLSDLKDTTFQVQDLRDLKNKNSRTIIDRVKWYERELRKKDPSNKVDLVIIDYVQQITHHEKTDGKTAALEKVCDDLSFLAKKENIAVIVGSQFGRVIEARGGAKRPMLSDFKYSGAIEENADWIFGLYRPEYYNILEDEEGNSLKGVLEVIFMKDRNAGQAGITWKLYYRNCRLREESYLEEEYQRAFAPKSDNNIIPPQRVNDDEPLPF